MSNLCTTGLGPWTLGVSLGSTTHHEAAWTPSGTLLVAIRMEL